MDNQYHGAFQRLCEILKYYPDDWDGLIKIAEKRMRRLDTLERGSKADKKKQAVQIVASIKEMIRNWDEG